MEYSIDVTNDLDQIEEEEYQSKMKEVLKVENFRREREFYGKFNFDLFWREN